MKRLALALALATATVAAHATDKPAASPTAAAAASSTAQPAGSSPSAVARKDVRNWSEIDTDRDHLISAEEMEKWLAAQWAARSAQAKN